MALNIPSTRKELKQKSQTDVQNSLPESNPFLPNSYLDAIITATSGRIYDFYLQLREVVKQMFVDTATGTFLERWGSYVGILRKPATQATGSITATGTSGSVIPIGTQVNTTNSLVYETLQSVTIADQTIQVVGIIRLGSVAVVETASPHLLTSSQTVTIVGANQTEYNGTFIITVTSAQEFTYTVSGAPTTPATGTIFANATFGSLSIRSVDYGEETNLDANTPLTFLTPIAGVDNTARVQFSGVSGGADQEDDTDLRNRILFRYQNPVALFNENAIIIQAQTVPGVTRVWVEGPGTLVNTLEVDSITRNDSIATVTTATSHQLEDGQIMQIFGADQAAYNILKKVIVIDDTQFAYSLIGAPATPATGTITCETGIPNGVVIIYFTRDNDENIIPTSSEVQAVKDALTNYDTGIMPANVDPNDVIVKAPVPVTVNFTFTLLSPNTPSMQTAIRNNLSSFFKESTAVSEDVLEVAYQAVIFRTIDPETGTSVTNFTLSTPTGNIAIQTGELAVLGTVTFL
jgi:uncharacterized phage protein gp47/JayE